MKRCTPFSVLASLTVLVCLALLAVHQSAFTLMPEVSFPEGTAFFPALENSSQPEAAASGAILEADRMDLNKATAGELERLPGIGPVLAQRIVTYREECGVFFSVEELTEVPGIGEKTLDSLRDYVTVGETGKAKS